MGEQRPPEFYDGIKYMKPYIYDRYKIIYQTVADMLPPAGECPKIIDLGCGVGYFAKEITGRKYSQYVGYDFSQQMIDHAQTVDNTSKFICRDLFDIRMNEVYTNNELFILIEVLEHIKNDRVLIGQLPAGSIIIISLPSYDAKSHVRYFKNIKQAQNRYVDLVEFVETKQIPWSKGNKVFVFKCVKK